MVKLLACSQKLYLQPGLKEWFKDYNTIKRHSLTCTQVGVRSSYNKKVVDSAHPPGVHARKGTAVRSLRSHVSWVQNVVRQFVLYLLCRKPV